MVVMTNELSCRQHFGHDVLVSQVNVSHIKSFNHSNESINGDGGMAHNIVSFDDLLTSVGNNVVTFSCTVPEALSELSTGIIHGHKKHYARDQIKNLIVLYCTRACTYLLVRMLGKYRH